jgi:hypothetical protein
MKIKLLLLILFIAFHFGFSQTEKLIQGKVLYNDLPLQGIEIINLASKKTTITDSDGQFYLLVKAKDSLMFISKNYEYKKIFLDSKLIEKK